MSKVKKITKFNSFFFGQMASEVATKTPALETKIGLTVLQMLTSSKRQYIELIE